MMNELFNNVHIIGCGGVASYIISPFVRTFRPESITFWDGDELEEKNLERQNFSWEEFDDRPEGLTKSTQLSDKFQNVAEALTDYDPEMFAFSEYFTVDKAKEHGIEPSLIYVFADNHPARKAALEFADTRYEEDGEVVPVIIAANEYHSSEAYIYYPDWNTINSFLDPRVRYPEILSETDGDPTLGCQAEQESSPQLAMSNMLAAAMALQLTWIWIGSEPRPEDLPNLAVELSANQYRNNNLTKQELERANHGD